MFENDNIDLMALVEALHNKEIEERNAAIFFENEAKFLEFLSSQSVIGLFLHPNYIAETWRYTLKLLHMCGFSGVLAIHPYGFTPESDNENTDEKIIDIQRYIPFFEDITWETETLYSDDEIEFRMVITKNFEEASVVFTDVIDPLEIEFGDSFVISLSSRIENEKRSFFMYTHIDEDPEEEKQRLIFEYSSFFENESFGYCHSAPPIQEIKDIPSTVRQYYNDCEAYTTATELCEYILYENPDTRNLLPAIIESVKSVEFSRLLIYIFTLMYKTASENPLSKPIFLPVFTDDTEIINTLITLFSHQSTHEDFESRFTELIEIQQVRSCVKYCSEFVEIYENAYMFINVCDIEGISGDLKDNCIYIIPIEQAPQVYIDAIFANAYLPPFLDEYTSYIASVIPSIFPNDFDFDNKYSYYLTDKKEEASSIVSKLNEYLKCEPETFLEVITLLLEYIQQCLDQNSVIWGFFNDYSNLTEKPEYTKYRRIMLYMSDALEDLGTDKILRAKSSDVFNDLYKKFTESVSQKDNIDLSSCNNLSRLAEMITLYSGSAVIDVLSTDNVILDTISDGNGKI
jgi:hypothetical protein